MNIVEALKLANSHNWIYRESANHRQIRITSDEVADLSLDELLAEDWMIEPNSVTITRDQFNAAWDNALLMIGTRLDRDALAKELGL